MVYEYELQASLQGEGKNSDPNWANHNAGLEQRVEIGSCESRDGPTLRPEIPQKARRSAVPFSTKQANRKTSQHCGAEVLGEEFSESQPLFDALY